MQEEVPLPRYVVKHVPTLTMENGLQLHSWVIGLPFFTVPVIEQEKRQSRKRRLASLATN
jgi:hypothetical protein